MVDEKSLLTDAEKAALEADLKATTDKLVSTNVQSQIDKIKAEAKSEAEKELALKQKFESQEAELKKLREEKEKLEKSSAEELARIKKKVDEMSASKATVNVQDPFKPVGMAGGGNGMIESMKDEQIISIEEQARNAFFNDDFSDIK